MSETITVIGADGHALSAWELAQVIDEAIEVVQARRLAAFEVMVARQVTATINKLRGRAD